MKLYYSPNSPYSRKVRVLCRELGLTEVKEIQVDTKDNDPGFIAANPLGKVPALTTPEGEVLFDSQVICEYIDQNYNEGRWQQQTWPDKVALAAVQGMMDLSVTMIIEKRRPEEKLFDYWLERYQVAIPRSLQWLSTHHGPSFTESPDLLSISLGCLLEYLDFRHPEVSWRSQVPEFGEWHDIFKRRQSMVQTRPK